jgi:hypothetical protein
VRFPRVQHIAGAVASYRLAQGDIAGARPIVAERLAAARLMALPHEVAPNLERLAPIAAIEGNLATTARLLGHVESCHAQRGVLRSFGAQAVHDRLLEVLRRRLAPGELEALAARGASLGEDAMVAEALAVVAAGS